MAAASLTTLGSWLCHYTTAEAAFAHIVPSGTLKMNPYSRMRDPLENKELAFRGGAFHRHRSNELERIQAIVAALGRFRDAMRLVSFTTDAEDYPAEDEPFGSGWSRARMWEQYAERHAGVCLVFDRERATQVLRAELNTLGAYWLGNVDYRPSGFARSPASAIPGGFHEDDVAKFFEHYHRAFLFLKTLDWETEREFRFVLMEGGSGRPPNVDAAVYVPFGDSLRYVIVGEHFPAWQVAAAMRVCESAGLQLRKMIWRDSRPAPWPIDP